VLPPARTVREVLLLPVGGGWPDTRDVGYYLITCFGRMFILCWFSEPLFVVLQPWLIQVPPSEGVVDWCLGLRD
jgi:hypothetical protein